MHGAQVQRITEAGIELAVDSETFWLLYADYPWFAETSRAAIERVERHGPDHLHWPDLDVDLSVTGLREPWRFPLQAKPWPEK
ncbi:hypothetical protein AN478_07010 [Thiohalorhabdus denitrificans]|nr:hypothetical protein AN478_07010 [Thiohalorhabdus denitrificans]